MNFLALESLGLAGRGRRARHHRGSGRYFLAAGRGAGSLAVLVVRRWRSSSWSSCPGAIPRRSFLDPDLPAALPRITSGPGCWSSSWAIVVSIVFLVRALRAARPAARAEPAPADGGPVPRDRRGLGGDPGPARPGADRPGRAARLSCCSRPTRSGPAALVQSAGLQLFARRPTTAAPIHAYATADGVLLSASGASAFGTQEADGVARLETLCRLLLAQQPRLPGRPRAWSSSSRSAGPASPTRSSGPPPSATTSGRSSASLKVRCPVFALFPEMETAPASPSSSAGCRAALRQSRCGFAVPASQAFSGDLVQRGLIWMSGWFHGWILSLMADDLLNQAGTTASSASTTSSAATGSGCGRCWSRRSRPTARASRSCSGAATSWPPGPTPASRPSRPACSAAPAGGVFAEHLATDWTAEAEADDRHYRRLALGVGLVGGAADAAGLDLHHRRDRRTPGGGLGAPGRPSVAAPGSSRSSGSSGRIDWIAPGSTVRTARADRSTQPADWSTTRNRTRPGQEHVARASPGGCPGRG